MQKRGNRDQIVLATKFTTAFRAGYGDKEIIVNSAGNGTKSLHLSLEASLKKLQTTYIDLVCSQSGHSKLVLIVFAVVRPLVGLHMLHP